MAEINAGRKVIHTDTLLELTNPGEWSALDADSKQIYSLIISTGRIRFDDGSNVRAMLLAIFGSSPITKAAIEAL